MIVHSSNFLPECLKLSIVDYLGSLTSFPLDYEIKKMRTVNITVAIQCERIKSISIFCQLGKTHIFWCAAVFVISLCVPGDEKG